MITMDSSVCWVYLVDTVLCYFHHPHCYIATSQVEPLDQPVHDFSCWSSVTPSEAIVRKRNCFTLKFSTWRYSKKNQKASCQWKLQTSLLWLACPLISLPYEFSFWQRVYMQDVIVCLGWQVFTFEINNLYAWFIFWS